MTRTGTNDPVLIATAERRRFVLNLRKSGATYQQIADAAVNEFGLEVLPKHWDRRSAWKDVHRELLKLASEIHDDAVPLRQLTYERLNRLLLAVWQRAITGDLEAIEKALKIIKQISTLMGVDAPVKMDVNQSGEVTFTVVYGNKLRDPIAGPSSEADGVSDEQGEA